MNEHKATKAKALARRRNHISICIKGTRMKLRAQRLLQIDNNCHQRLAVASVAPAGGSICIDEAEDELVLSTTPCRAQDHEATRLSRLNPSVVLATVRKGLRIVNL